MITFFVTLLAHCFGRRPIDGLVWYVAVMIGILELMVSAVVLSVVLK